MFSLIISIISIALVAALAAATVYFGGAAFNKGAAGADASAFINAGQQIAGAYTLASTDNAVVTTDVESLVTAKYLAQVPTYKGNELTVATNGYLTIPAVTADVCTEVNKRANGVDGSGNVAAVTAQNGLFGCVTADRVPFYKVSSDTLTAPVTP